MGRPFPTFRSVIQAQQGHLFPFAPVCLAMGIGGYFLLKFEPPLWFLVLCAVSIAGFLWIRRLGAFGGAVLAAIVLALVGFALAGARAHYVAAPVLEYRYYGTIEGRVIALDRSASDAVRVTLDRVVMSKLSAAKTPERVRVSLHGDQSSYSPKADDRVRVTAHLSPPGGAVEPGGFDFKRHAWFQRLGGVGYARKPMTLVQSGQGGQPVFRARMWLSERVRSHLDGQTGAFGAVIMAGDRSALDQDLLRDLRNTNLAHLLAISGLHLGLLSGFVFMSLRLILLLIPHCRHHWPVKKLAAGGALLTAAGYLLLSGGAIATQRAFVMAAAALLAVMLDRRALSLRVVAIAALIILVLRPEALLSPGFQMSFAATTALVAVFEKVSELQSALPRWIGGFVGLVLSSAVAGAATAPVGMVHFNQVAQYGLLANLLSVPVMGVWVVPWAVIAVVLMPLGLDGVAMQAMGLGLDWILLVADQIGQWPGALRPVKAPIPIVLPLIGLGGALVCGVRGLARLIAIVPVSVAIILWTTSPRPQVLISDQGTLVGVWSDGARALSRDKGAGFVARNWLENDGSTRDQWQSAQIWPGERQKLRASAVINASEILHLRGKRQAQATTKCTPDQIIVSDKWIHARGGCRVFDADYLRRSGSVALNWQGGDLQITTAAQLVGNRLWAH